MDGAALSLLPPLLAGGFMAAFLHAALPTHWLPFALISRAQGWNSGATFACVAAAGLAHILSTGLVGGLIVLAGLALEEWVEGVLPLVSAVLLALFGGYYLIKALIRRPAVAGGPQIDAPEAPTSHAAAFWGLVGIMAVSPGEVLLPFYLTVAEQGLVTLALLTLSFLIGTVAGMTLFTGLARAGASLLRLNRLARYESAILGLALIAVALLVVLRPH